MSASREIITLQVGNYSNYVGAHWFNLQQEYLSADSEFDAHVLWREGLSLQRKPIWTPRVLIFDLKNNWVSQSASPSDLGTARSSGSETLRQAELTKELDKTEKEVHWDGKVERVVQQNASFSARTELVNEKKKTPGSSSSGRRGEVKAEKEPQSWNDYTQWKLHSKDGVGFSLSDFSHNSTLGVLSNYEQGLQIYQLIQDEVMDGIRRYAEPCDYFAGFHLLADQSDGFGGLASGILEHISDDYEKKSRLAIGLSPPSNTCVLGDETLLDYRRRIGNIVQTWNAFNCHSSLFTSLGLSKDLSIPNPTPKKLSLLNYQSESAYQSSAVLAAALDTITASYRLQSPSLHLHELIGVLGAYGHKMTMLGSAFPLALVGEKMEEKTLYETLTANGLNMLHCLTPGLPALIDLEKSFGNFFITRGVPDESVIRNSDRERLARGSGGISNAQSCMELYSQEACSKSVNVVRSVVTPFKLSQPFPTLLVDQTYLQSQPKTRYQNKDAWNLPALGSAHNNLLVGEMLEKMINVAQSGKMREPDVDVDEHEEYIHELKTLRESYTKY